MAHERGQTPTPVYPPEKGNNHGPANRRPDTPAVQAVRFKELTYRIIGRCDVPVCGVSNNVRRITVDNGRLGRKPALEVTPTLVNPILAPTFVSRGGGRSIGGGTSKEALRRQKEKARRQVAVKRSGKHR